MSNDKTKPWFRSLTFWGLIASLLGVLLAGIGRGDPALDIVNDHATQGVIGEILLYFGLASSFYGRARAKETIRFRRQKKRLEK